MKYRDFSSQNLSDLYDSDAVKQSIRNIVFTEVGELLGLPDFGCKTKSMLFEQFDMFSANTMKTIILNSLYKYESRIENISVNLQNDQPNHSLICYINFTISEINNEETVAIRLK